MENNELETIWKSFDRKIDDMLIINKDLAINISRQKINKQISKLYLPKWTAVLIGLPYTLILIGITMIATIAKAYVVAIGFGVLSILMILVLSQYFYQLYLISQIRNNEEVLSTQKQLSQLRISSFNSLNLSVFQLPFG